MVSIKSFSTLLNNKIPMKNIIKVNIDVYNNAIEGNCPCPNNEYLNISKIVVIGFKAIQNCRFLGAADNG